MNAPSSGVGSVPIVWSAPKRFGFRFGIICAALLLFPFPLDIIPKIEWLTNALDKPKAWLLDWFATVILGLDAVSHEPNGSGDTTADYVFRLLVVVIAIIGTAVWSVLDRRRRSYPRLAAFAVVVLRYYLAYVLIRYATAKLAQFPPPSPGRLDQRVGDMSPMGMLWTFMGSSQPYCLFSGVIEALGGALLLWRRTSVAGALLAIAAMTNVVTLNFCYDVPVKLFSLQLLFIAILLALPHARRLLAAVLGYATPEVLQPPHQSKRRECARAITHWLFIASLLTSRYLLITERISQRFPPKHELYGIWRVEKFTLNGNERPPYAEHWRKVAFSHQRVYVRMLTDEEVDFATTVDSTQHTIKFKRKPEAAGETWRYMKSSDDQPSLVIDGTLGGKRVHVTLKREPDPLLVARDFHWINEVPFNR